MWFSHLGDGWQVLVGVEHLEDGPGTDPDLAQPVRHGHKAQVGAPLSRHPVGARGPIFVEFLQWKGTYPNRPSAIYFYYILFLKLL